MVTFPTRKSNTLDIFVTNKSGIVDKCISIPGIGDHEAIYVESTILAIYTALTHRKNYIYFIFISNIYNLHPYSQERIRATHFISHCSVTAITFIVAYCVCVKRTLDKANTHNLKQQSPGPREKVLYEQVSLPSHTVTKNDLELQPNPAYGTSHKVIMNNNPAYKSCK